ncbi:MAG: hypothetical protein NC429_09650 [Lachnospiraceae bacterium]|nr:hypothetical protein [Lachnospiraceae bacterium]
MNGQSVQSVKNRLTGLLEMSKDPQYDRYINQMIRDLESGKASPEQVEREASRTYEIYKQRMGIPAGHSVEFKVGIHLFGMVGAVFVLAALVIFSFNFLNVFWQGICFYVAALALIILSELLLYKKLPAFSHVITGIGVGVMYIAGIVNYLILHTFNGIAAMGITLVIAAATIFYGRKRESTTIRLIALLGFYVCMLFMGSFRDDLSFLMLTGMLFIINMVCVFFQQEKNRSMINMIHLIANILFMSVIAGMAWGGQIGAVYLIIFLVTSFIVMNFMSYVQCREGKGGELFPFICIGNGLCLFLFFLIGNMGTGMEAADVALFVHLVAEILVLVVCALSFLFWNKDDRRRWSQVYYAVFAILLLNSFSEYELESVLGILTAFLLVKLCSKQKEISVLEAITSAWVGLMGFWFADYWFCWVLAGALVIGMCRVCYRAFHLEIITVTSILLIWWRQCYYVLDEHGFDDKWFYPVCAVILLIFFLLFNNLPWLKKYNQQPYNIFSIIFMSGTYLTALLVRDTAVCLVMMVLGTASIMLVFSKRYQIHLPRRYLVAAVFLTCYALLGSFFTPVIASILLMAVALTCVGIGFKVDDKGVRIYGLITAALVCLKLVLYDFIEVGTFYRIIVFLAVGVLALFISFLYILLEKKADRKRAEKLNRAEQEERIPPKEPSILTEQNIQEERKLNDETFMD